MSAVKFKIVDSLTSCAPYLSRKRLLHDLLRAFEQRPSSDSHRSVQPTNALWTRRHQVIKRVRWSEGLVVINNVMCWKLAIRTARQMSTTWESNPKLHNPAPNRHYRTTERSCHLCKKVFMIRWNTLTISKSVKHKLSYSLSVEENGWNSDVLVQMHYCLPSYPASCC